MNRAGWITFGLALGLLLLSVWIQPQGIPSTHTVERIEGPLKTIDRFDPDGRRHGLQESWINGVISQERMAEHGLIVWRKEYDTQGHLVEHWVENEGLILSRESGQTN